MMSEQPGFMKRMYNAIALFALLNMVMLAAGVAYLFATGAVDSAKLRQVGMIVRGVSLPSTKPAAPDVAQDHSAKPATPVAAPPETDVDIEIAYRESERIKTELEQRLALSNSILLKVRTEREAFEKEREAVKLRDEAAARVQGEEGFRKQVAILESVAPKVAIQHLLSLPDSDEAAKVLTAMDTAKAKKIVESAKRGDDLSRMKTILQRVREVAPTRLADLSENER